jgi:hypothetical protein
MDCLLKIVKVAALAALILVFVVLLAPTLKGPFVIIHFMTALRGWLLAQIVLLGFALSATHLLTHLMVRHFVPVLNLPQKLRFSPWISPLRC